VEEAPWTQTSTANRCATALTHRQGISQRSFFFAKKMGCKPQPVPVGVDDLLQVYGSQEEVDRVCTPRQPGDLQLEHPIHVHRAPPPPPPGSKTYRRTIFVSWDHGKVINASLTTVFADSWKSLWENNNLLEVEPERVLKRQKR
jgi:hypothetical protein